MCPKENSLVESIILGEGTFSYKNRELSTTRSYSEIYISSINWENLRNRKKYIVRQFFYIKKNYHNYSNLKCSFQS